MRVSLRTVVAVLLLLLVVNAAYIWALPAPTIVYMANVLAHLVGGVLFCAAGAMLLARERDLRRPLELLASLALDRKSVV